MFITDFKINGIYGMHNCVVDLSRRANVLVGPNGSGKSSILKIIKYFFNGDFVNLVSIPFNYIEWSDWEKNDTTAYRLNYEDLFPGKDAIMNGLLDRMGENTDQNYQEIKQLLKALDKQELFYEYIATCYFHKSFSFEIKRIHMKHNGYDGRRMIDYSKLIVEYLDASLVKQNHRCYFKGSNVEARILSKKGSDSIPHNENYIYLDLVEKYSVNSGDEKSCGLSSSTLDWITQLNPKQTDKYDDRRNNLVRFARKYGRQNEEFITEIRRMYESIDDFRFDATLNSNKQDYLWGTIAKKDEDYLSQEDLFIGRVLNDKIIDINSLISRYYYKDEFVKDINKKALNVSKDLLMRDIKWMAPEIIRLINNISKGKIKVVPGSYEEKIFEKHKQHMQDLHYADQLKKDYELLHDIDQYVCPILDENQLINFNSTEITMLNKSHNRIDSLPIIKLAEFYHQEIDNFKKESNKTTKIINFENMMKKYITDKEVRIYPSGLHIFKRYSSVHKRKEFSVYQNKENSIDLNQLSSGEKKLILLFAIAILIDNKNLILDEPELSLSIVWQENLLNDLLENSHCQFLAATHSPYIVSQNDVADYITYLPMG